MWFWHTCRSQAGAYGVQGTGLPSQSGSRWGGQVHVILPCWSCLLPLIWVKMGQSLCSRAWCSNLVGKRKYLDRAPAHHMVVEWDVNSGAHQHFWPWSISTVSGVLLWSTAFSIQSLLFVVERVVLCRSDLLVDFMCQLILVSWIEPEGAYGIRGTGPPGWSGPAGRPDRRARCPWWCPACFSCSFSLFRGKRPQVMYLGMSCGDLAGKPKHPSSTPPTLWRWKSM